MVRDVSRKENQLLGPGRSCDENWIWFLLILCIYFKKEDDIAIFVSWSKNSYSSVKDGLGSGEKGGY